MPQETLTLPEALRRAQSASDGGRFVEAEKLCRAIIAVEAAHVDALHLLALVQHRRGRSAEAVTTFDRALAFAPGEANLFVNRALALQALRLFDEALQSCEQALALMPGHFEALNNRAVVLSDLKRYDEALATCDLALALRPDDIGILNNRGIALKGLKRPLEALACYDRVLSLDANHADALSNRGNALSALKRHEEALACYDRVLALRPDDADAWSHRGNALKALMRFDAAIASHDRALALRPGSALAHYNRALALQDMHRHDAALASLERAIALKPDYADAFNSRGHALKQLRRVGEAAASYERALAIDPDHPYAFGGVIECASGLCDWRRQDELRAEACRRAAEGPSIVPPLILVGYSDDEALQFACAKRYIDNKIDYPPPAIVTGEVWRNERIKVAYLSPDFRQHPVGQLIPELIERHDRSRFEAIGISFGPDDRSSLRQRLVAGFDRFHDVNAMSDREAAMLMADMRIDIAVDLAGYTMGHRPAILAHRPTPISVAYLGYPVTMAANFIDYIVADRIVLPFERQPFYGERIVHLPDCFMACDTTRSIAAVAPSRRDAGLPDEGFVFCCFNNPTKITGAMFDVWMRLLHAVSGSVLWLSGANGAIAENFKRGAAERGVDPSRLVFAPRLDRLDEHLARHRLADLFLDTLPYNAHTTANDALWAGLPVLTSTGNCFAGRVASSLLGAVGLPELVTANLADYEAMALELATTPARLAELRARLARNRATAPVFDGARFTRHMEAAYRTMWERWQSGERPASFAVPASDFR
jgi:predicted O-linked N-acetylglucosamine transferase (SPINDLY family)